MGTRPSVLRTYCLDVRLFAQFQYPARLHYHRTNPVHWTEFLDHAMNPVYGDTEPRDEQVGARHFKCRLPTL